EHVAGMFHIGTGPAQMPDRPLPDLSAISQWIHE
ncbi:MAG TPA: nitroreductase, partial [Planktomarina temperata]|nr:nitroreductase [Planktomarina temperata]